MLLGSVDELLRRLARSNRSGDGDGLSTCVSDAGCSLLGNRRVHVVDDDGGPLAREPARIRESQSAATSGDDGYLA